MARILLVLALVAGACVQPDVTSCPTVDCPKDEVCDGRGGCALPAQLSACSGQADGTSCSYTDRTTATIDGACLQGLCLPLGCGNALQTPNEACDDGNTVNGDGCSADCQSTEVCGNGITDSAKGEQCDDGNTVDGDGCQTTCKLPRCGDGVKDSALDEQCDAGSANSTDPDAVCRPNCQLPRCGDGVKDVLAGEVCDDGNNLPHDGCSGDCTSNETCGNSVVDVLAGEVCDDGNTASGDGCAADCKSAEVCGNGVVDASRGEICDDSNTVSGDGCSSDCKSLEVCGNSIVDTITEQCDKGTQNSNAPNSACRTNCKLPKCGDSIIDNLLGEMCDSGLMNADVADACRTNCQLPRCGDNIKDTTETCDDGNTISGDGCSADCNSLEVCGNGIIDSVKGEQCDVGTSNADTPNATCRTNCKLPRCGDAIVDNISLGEGCDLGAQNSNSPDATCRLNCQPQRCGDGILDTAKGEVCDDGNATAGDGCSADCKSKEVCGNGIVDVVKGEQCDAGTGVNADTPNAPCRTTCKLPKCGDSIVDNISLGESCDNGTLNSNQPNAACRTSCQPRRCGDGIFDNTSGEACDDGNTVAGDGCSGDCVSNETCGNGIVDLVKGEQCDDANGRTRDGCSACKPENAQVMTPNGAPNKRDSHAIAYDAARHKVVMYGGWTVDGNLADTWEWDGASWTEIHTAHSPGTRLDAAIAYDAKRRRIVLFGGYNGNYTGFRGDTWEYDGVDWTQKTPTASPPPLASAAASYDANRKTVVLYGGRSGDATQGTATWEYNGTTWTKLAPAANPGVREGARMAYDAKNNYIVLFGGGNMNTWTWNGTTWIDRGAATGITSSGYDANAIAFDAQRQAIVMWDGTVNTTFEWDGTTNTWTGVTSTTPTTPRSYINMAYDASRQQMVMFGGYGLVTGTPPNTTTDDYADTWLRDAAGAWSQPAAWTEPTARFRAGAGYDPTRGRTVLFGGRDDTFTDLADTWEWNGSKWQSITPTASPTAREGQRLAFNTSTKTLMSFSGNDEFDIWAYNGTTWTQQTSSTTGRNPVRNGAMSYDIVNNKIVTFGGREASVVDSTYTWTTAGWALVAPATKPAARKNHAMAYDQSRQRSVMFSGFDDGQNPLSDVWEYNGATSTWAPISTTIGPDARGGLELVYNPDAARVMVIGNSGGASGEDLWEWTGTGWNQRQLFGGSVPINYRAAIAYDALRHALVVFGGRDNGFTAQAGTQLVAYWPNQTVEACTSAQIDYDNDGKAGCADEECWAVCTPLCPPGGVCNNTVRCGDAVCSAIEDCDICPADCGQCAGGKCGDFHCDSATESTTTCPNDCP